MNAKSVNLLVALGLVGLGVWMFTGERAPGNVRGQGDALDGLGSKLVERRGEQVVPADPDRLTGKEFVALYFSAHWCPPCRQFTPHLSAFYDRMAAEHPEFELILISSDRDAESMEEYMRWGKMDFPAVAFDEIGNSGLRERGARGIPYLVVLDADGNEIISKGRGDYLSPNTALAQLQKLLEES